MGSAGRYTRYCGLLGRGFVLLTVKSFHQFCFASHHSSDASDECLPYVRLFNLSSSASADCRGCGSVLEPVRKLTFLSYSSLGVLVRF